MVGLAGALPAKLPGDLKGWAWPTRRGSVTPQRAEAVTQALTREYEDLREQVGEILLAGRERVRQAVEREKVRVSWEVGRLLDQHLVGRGSTPGPGHGGGRGAYGEGVIRRLAADLEMDARRLYEMMALYRASPKIRPTGQLSYTHYVNLLRVPGWQARAFYQKAALDGGWSVRQLAEAIRGGVYEREAGAAGEVGERGELGTGSEGGDGGAEEARRAPLLPLTGRLFTYRVLEAGARYVKLDLGFRVRLVLAGDGSALEAGGAAESVEVVEAPSQEAGAFVAADGRRFDLRPDAVPRRKLYTYGARVQKVVDGDTLWVEIDCGFGVSIEEKLRLRGVDTPELRTPEGERAREFVVQSLLGCERIVLATSTVDLYDRYVADVLFLRGEKDCRRVLAEGRYLNGELVAAGMARRWV